MSVDLGELLRRGKLDWLTAAVLIARDVCPGLEPSQVNQQLDALCRPLSESLLAALSPAKQAQALTDYLGRRVGFSGNEADYEDPRNSLIDQVLERRLGIPISLALVYVEVARRVGVDAVGVGFPGHFLVQVRDTKRVGGLDRSVLLDPFAGAVLGREDLELLAERATGSAEVQGEWLRPANTRQIVLRMLGNLRAAYVRAGDHRRLLVILHRMCELEREPTALLRDRGVLQAKLGAPRAAIADLEAYLNALPQAPDAQKIAELIDELSHSLHHAGAQSSLN